MISEEGRRVASVSDIHPTAHQYLPSCLTLVLFFWTRLGVRDTLLPPSILYKRASLDLCHILEFLSIFCQHSFLNQPAERHIRMQKKCVESIKRSLAVTRCAWFVCAPFVPCDTTELALESAYACLGIKLSAVNPRLIPNRTRTNEIINKCCIVHSEIERMPLAQAQQCYDTNKRNNLIHEATWIHSLGESMWLDSRGSRVHLV